MARRERETKLKNSSLDSKRKENNVDQRAYVILACEGEKTENFYFKAFFEDLKKHKQLSPRSCVIATHQHTNPSGVLSDLINHKAGFGISYEDFEYKWIVIDRDPERVNGGGHTPEDFQAALLQAEQKGISVAWSNPCFELWILLHYQYRNTSIDRDDFSSILSPLLGKKYEKNDSSLYSNLKHLREDALKNARKLWAQNNSIRPLECNPCTKIFELIDSLMNETAKQ